MPEELSQQYVEDLYYRVMAQDKAFIIATQQGGRKARGSGAKPVRLVPGAYTRTAIRCTAPDPQGRCLACELGMELRAAAKAAQRPAHRLVIPPPVLPRLLAAPAPPGSRCPDCQACQGDGCDPAMGEEIRLLEEAENRRREGLALAAIGRGGAP